MWDTDLRLSPQGPCHRRAPIPYLYLRERHQCRKEVSLRNKRQDKRLHFPRTTLEYGNRSFYYFGPHNSVTMYLSLVN